MQNSAIKDCAALKTYKHLLMTKHIFLENILFLCLPISLMPIIMYAPAYSTRLIHYRSFTKSKDKVYVNITSALFINKRFILDEMIDPARYFKICHIF